MLMQGKTSKFIKIITDPLKVVEFAGLKNSNQERDILTLIDIPNFQLSPYIKRWTVSEHLEYPV